MAAPVKKTMFNYFTKLPSKTNIIEENPRKIAPLHNEQHVKNFQDRLEQFESELYGDNNLEKNYLSTIKSSEHYPYRFTKKPRGPLRARLLQFCEDVRPPYFGTWQKTSKIVTGRRPTALDNDVFDYENDSEAEWDIGGPGESLKGDDSEDEEEQDDYEIDMKTFVPHGYVSDDEVAENSDNEENQSANQSIEENLCGQENEDSDSSVKVISEINVTKSAPQQTAANQAPPKQTPKMDIKPIVLGLSYEDNPSISESKTQFLRAFEGFSCSAQSVE